MLTNTKSIFIMGEDARCAFSRLLCISGEQKAAALAAMPSFLNQAKPKLVAANQADIEDAKSSGLPAPLLNRLELNEKIFSYLEDRLRKVAELPDPVGRVLEEFTNSDGLHVSKISVPIGVIGIIYESRPNVTVDAASVCLKSGNAVILRGGSESLRTNLVLAEAMIEALMEHGIPGNVVQIVQTADRKAVRELLQLDKFIDLLIPRGGKSLIERVATESRIPVLKHYEGICHLYLAADAPLEMAIALCINSKCERVEVCNSLETVLVDTKSAARLLPDLVKAFEEKDVEVRGCEHTIALIPTVKAAHKTDWSTEYLAPIISIKIVTGLEQAVAHISKYGSGHTDGIVTSSPELADKFIQTVDSASVLVNASTRLSGGGAYGLGAVVGISTDKLHARGPVGPEELTSYKWVAQGNGHLRK